MNRPYRVRLARPHDADLIASHRALMYRDMGEVDLATSEALREACRPFLCASLKSGQYLGWLVEDDDDGIVAGAGVSLRELAPYPGCYRPGRAASIGNVYTIPTHRRRGVARMLMEVILRWCEEHAIDQVTLSASEQGRQLYEQLGFIPTEEMRLSRKT